MSVPSAAFAALPPHVAQSDDTDVCAMCHRVSTAAADVDTEWSRMLADQSGEPSDTKNALLVGLNTEKDDTTLCYSCHGLEKLGSASDVQSQFRASSTHTLAPAPVAYGRSPLQCSTCHDTHGENRVNGAPRPALLRSIVSSTQIYYSGAQYCASCHPDRPLDRWDGIDVWNGTAHASLIPTPSSGTGIVCSVCHDPHGSNIAPSLEPTVMPPAVLPAEGLRVAANDRTLCLNCHLYSVTPTSWVSSATYAPSAHGSSVATVAIQGEWVARDLASSEASRAVGECQVCHAPMGRKAASGGTIPKLLDKKGRQLCDSCHGDNGPARSNIATLAYPASRVDTEVVAVWRPSVETSIYGDVAVYTRDVTTTVPAALDGPRVLKPSYRAGDAAAGDIDNNGTNELVVADPSRSVVDVFKQDAVRGLRRTSLAVGAHPYLMTVANVVDHGTGPQGANDRSAEIAIVERDPLPPHASTLLVYAYTGSTLELLSSLTVGDDASGIAAGHVTGTALADLVVTSVGDDAFRVFSEDLGTDNPARLAQVGGSHGTGAGTEPRGVSIANVRTSDSDNEIVICDSGVSSGQVSVFTGAGAPVASYATGGETDAKHAYDSVVADVLGGSSPEVVVALRSDPTTDSIAATSSVAVFPVSASGLDGGGRLNYETGTRYESSAVEAGDVDGDGESELIVGNSGKWLRGGIRRAPSLQVFDSAGGSTLSLERTLWSTGVEQASGIQETTTTASGTAPAIVVADLGAVGPSRHPGDAGTVTHVSTETAGFQRHVTCSDCHNSHETTATVQTAPSNVFGALKGAFGALITNTGSGAAITYAQTSSVTAEYQVCLKCHSAYATLDGTRNIASEVNTRNASTHGVEGPSGSSAVPAATFEAVVAGIVNSTATWSSSSQLYCTDCHGNSDTAQARGPHASGEGSLLRKPLWGVPVSDSGMLCYLCHKRSVYYGGDSGSLFRHFGKPDMHKIHTQDDGFSCRTCHESHGSSTLAHLQNSDHNYEHNADGGACATACHTGGARHAYSRSAVTTPTDLGVTLAATYTGNLASVLARDGSELVVSEANGSSPAYSIEMTFTGVTSMPSGVEFYGRYQGAAGHIVEVQAWNYSLGTWVSVGTWPSTLVRGVFSFALTDANFRSANTMRVRIIHTSPGNPNHRHYIDSAWLDQ